MRTDEMDNESGSTFLIIQRVQKNNILDRIDEASAKEELKRAIELATTQVDLDSYDFSSDPDNVSV